MLVYGQPRNALPRAALDRLATELAALNAHPPGLDRHGASVGLFIRLAELVTGFADAQAAALGHEEGSPALDRLYAALRGFARWTDRSWRSGFVDQPALPPDAIRALTDLPWPATVTVKPGEGYAHYALYPETYLEAARGLPADSIVIGLRSIGTGLAALVAAAAGAGTMLTVRPAGHPFARGVTAGPALEARLRAAAHRHFVVVDEGPGLSGSSFGGAADWLGGLGVAPDRITFMPSHPGDPGDRATPALRRRWARADKRHRDFADLFTGPTARAPIAGWFADLTGPLLAPPRELSGGAWADGRADVATSPSREARKYLLDGAHGRFLVKFAGLGDIAQRKFDRATALHAAGFCPEPLATRHGFTIERWVEGTRASDIPVAHLIDYLAFRQAHLPAPRPGASLAQLAAMAHHNLAEVAPDAAAALAGRWTVERAEALQPLVRPVHVDARLHAWEWLHADGRLLKCDAVDHSQAHDLVGCQDILWDVAGAIAELPAAAADPHALAAAFTDGVPARVELLDLMSVAYHAFQLGWWSFSGAGAARSNRYARALIAALGG